MGEKELREPHLADCKHRDVLAMTTHTRAAVLEMADELRNHARFPHKRLQHEAGQLCRNAEAMLRDLAPPEQPDAVREAERKLEEVVVEIVRYNRRHAVDKTGKRCK